jgi:hypothetical protein
MLKVNDLVKMIHMDDDLERMGFKKGNYYLVTKGVAYVGERPIEGLVIQSALHEVIMLIDQDGELTDYCDNVSLKVCPVTLPRSKQ